MNDLSDYEQTTIRRAIRILEKRASYSEFTITSPDSAKELAFLKLANQKNESFCVAFLTNRHTLISFEEMFHGTVDGASVYPRVVAQRALEVNAVAVVLVHNHPSGISDPSMADQRITTRLKDALALVDIRILDHLIIGGTLSQTYSFAEHGLL